MALPPYDDDNGLPPARPPAQPPQAQAQQPPRPQRQAQPPGPRAQTQPRPQAQPPGPRAQVPGLDRRTKGYPVGADNGGLPSLGPTTTITVPRQINTLDELHQHIPRPDPAQVQPWIGAQRPPSGRRYRQDARVNPISTQAAAAGASTPAQMQRYAAQIEVPTDLHNRFRQNESPQSAQRRLQDANLVYGEQGMQGMPLLAQAGPGVDGGVDIPPPGWSPAAPAALEPPPIDLVSPRAPVPWQAPDQPPIMPAADQQATMPIPPVDLPPDIRAGIQGAGAGPQYFTDDELAALARQNVLDDVAGIVAGEPQRAVWNPATGRLEAARPSLDESLAAVRASAQYSPGGPTFQGLDYSQASEQWRSDPQRQRVWAARRQQLADLEAQQEQRRREQMPAWKQKAMMRLDADLAQIGAAQARYQQAALRDDRRYQQAQERLDQGERRLLEQERRNQALEGLATQRVDLSRERMAQPAPPPRAYRWTDSGELEPVPGGPADRLTGEQAGRAAMLAQAATDMEQATALVIDPATGEVNRTIVLQAAVPGGGAPFTDGRTLYTLINNAVAGRLRAETGAAANASEVVNISQRFMPSPLDSDATIKLKLQRMSEFLDQGLAALGPAAQRLVPDVTGREPGTSPPGQELVQPEPVVVQPDPVVLSRQEYKARVLQEVERMGLPLDDPESIRDAMDSLAEQGIFRED